MGEYVCGWRAHAQQPWWFGHKLNSRSRMRRYTNCCFHSVLGVLQNFPMETLVMFWETHSARKKLLSKCRKDGILSTNKSCFKNRLLSSTNHLQLSQRDLTPQRLNIHVTAPERCWNCSQQRNCKKPWLKDFTRKRRECCTQLWYKTEHNTKSIQ